MRYSGRNINACIRITCKQNLTSTLIKLSRNTGLRNSSMCRKATCSKCGKLAHPQSSNSQCCRHQGAPYYIKASSLTGLQGRLRGSDAANTFPRSWTPSLKNSAASALQRSRPTARNIRPRLTHRLARSCESIHAIPCDITDYLVGAPIGAGGMGSRIKVCVRANLEHKLYSWKTTIAFFFHFTLH
jgi:hypothetical protein